MSKPEILFNLSEDIIKTDPNATPSSSSSTTPKVAEKPTQIPAEHQFAISDIKQQTLAVFSQGMNILMIKFPQPNCDGNAIFLPLDENKSLALEGTVVQKGECRPIGNAHYMMLKKESIRIASQPTKIVQKIDRAVNNFKPINAHRSEVKCGLRFPLKEKS